MSDETTWVDGPNGKIPFNIQTQAGREIWTEINLKGGSIYWGPLGRALPEVEAEAMRMAEERIKKLLDDSSRICKCTPTCLTDVNIVAFVIEELGINIIDLIDGKGENK